MTVLCSILFRMQKKLLYIKLKVIGCSPHPIHEYFKVNSLLLTLVEGQIMPTILLLPPPDFQTFLQPCTKQFIWNLRVIIYYVSIFINNAFLFFSWAKYIEILCLAILSIGSKSKPSAKVLFLSITTFSSRILKSK